MDGYYNNPVQVPYIPNAQKVHVDLSDVQRAALTNKRSEPTLAAPINLAATFGTNVHDFSTQFNGMEKMDDATFFNLVANTYEKVISYGVKTSTQDEKALLFNLFSNKRYLNTLAQVLSNIYVPATQILCINRTIYDAELAGQREKEVWDARLAVLRSANKDIIRTISHINLPNANTAAEIAMYSFSNDEPFNNVKRLNFHLVMSGWEGYDEFTLVALYQELFGNQMTALTEGIMFDNWGIKLNTLTEKQKDIYYKIDMSLLYMLEQAPAELSHQVLRAYAVDWSNYFLNALESGNNITLPEPKFHFILSGDFPRLNNTIEVLRCEGIFVP